MHRVYEITLRFTLPATLHDGISLGQTKIRGVQLAAMSSCEDADNTGLFACILGGLEKGSQFNEEFVARVEMQREFLVDAFSIVVEASKC